MPIETNLARLLARARASPAALRYVATVVVVCGLFALGREINLALSTRHPFLPSIIVLLLCAALFGPGAGIVATVTAGILVAYYYLPPAGSLSIEAWEDVAGLLLFVGIGAVGTFIIEALHRVIARLQRAERARALLLREFRHRTRNDLNALVGLLRLRARAAPSEAAREGLHEASGYALALARVHTRLEPADRAEAEETAFVDTREFILGLCADIERSVAGEGLRPVSVTAEAEAYSLPTNRAVPLGLVLNEAVTNALKYAFPEERSGTVRVRFTREDGDYVLTVSDDGIGLPPEGELEGSPPAAPPGGSGLGTRILRGLAAQLRGSFTRASRPGGVGAVVTLRFPAAAPTG